MFVIVNTQPVFNNRDGITGYRSVLAHPNAFETSALAFYTASRMNEADGYCDGYEGYDVFDLATGLPVHTVETVSVPLPEAASEIAF